MLDINGCVIDFKTAAKRPNGILAERRLQLTTYAMRRTDYTDHNVLLAELNGAVIAAAEAKAKELTGK